MRSEYSVLRIQRELLRVIRVKYGRIGVKDILPPGNMTVNGDQRKMHLENERNLKMK